MTASLGERCRSQASATWEAVAPCARATRARVDPSSARKPFASGAQAMKARPSWSQRARTSSDPRSARLRRFWTLTISAVDRARGAPRGRRCRPRWRPPCLRPGARPGRPLTPRSARLRRRRGAGTGRCARARAGAGSPRTLHEEPRDGSRPTTRAARGGGIHPWSRRAARHRGEGPRATGFRRPRARRSRRCRRVAPPARRPGARANVPRRGRRGYPTSPGL